MDEPGMTCTHDVEKSDAYGHITCLGCGHVRIAPIEMRSRVRITDVADLNLVGVHPADACAGQSACPMHNPSDHHMRAWEVVWRADRGILERICPRHGVGHPDPDQFPYWDANGMEAEAVHGCCLCCRPMLRGNFLDVSPVRAVNTGEAEVFGHKPR